MAGIGCGLLIFASVLLAVLLIIDGLVLLGSMIQNKVVLIVALALQAIIILVLVAVGVYLVYGFGPYFIPFFILSGYKLWTSIIGIGAVQELKLRKYQPVAPIKMYDLVYSDLGQLIENSN